MLGEVGVVDSSRINHGPEVLETQQADRSIWASTEEKVMLRFWLLSVFPGLISNVYLGPFSAGRAIRGEAEWRRVGGQICRVCKTRKSEIGR